MTHAIVVDPESYARWVAFKQARILCQAFCSENEVILPLIIAGECRHNYGEYDPRKKQVTVNVTQTRLPVKTPGYAWSYTGYKADLTAPGVTAHEVGHHVWYQHGCPIVTGSRGLARVWRLAIADEPLVSSYGRSAGEDFAESMKLFILNPDLLQLGRPRRFRFLRETLELKPIVEECWTDVLEHAHPRLIKAAENWIKQGHRVAHAR